MRRYISHFFHLSYRKLFEEALRYDVIIVGSGLAGLYAALHLDPGLSVALVSKGGLDSGSSWLVQGGIAAVLEPDDNKNWHYEDTLKAGAGHCDPDAVRVLVDEAPQDIKTLVDLKVPFDRKPDGSLHVTREGGHNHNRIVHCGGDATGKAVTSRLGELVFQKENVRSFQGSYLVDILTHENKAYGILINDREGERILLSHNIIIATGGSGQLYKYSTTPKGNTGEGISACFRAGAEIKDMEFVQFHPTALAVQTEGERMFLISEAVRGEGAILRNKCGDPFMIGIHPMADLAPRDIVTRAILMEMDRTGDDKVYLDARQMSPQFFENRFPTITAECNKNGIYPPKDLIPVVPTQHYLMGGVKADLHSRTSVEGLFACGEVSCTGVHGANRLASNSTLECLVFSRRAAQYINDHIKHPAFVGALTDITDVTDGKEECLSSPPNENEFNQTFLRIKELMTEKVGAIRKRSELLLAQKELLSIYDKYSSCYFENTCQYKVYNAIEAALMVVNAAVNRKESVGAHYLTEE